MKVIDIKIPTIILYIPFVIAIGCQKSVNEPAGGPIEKIEIVDDSGLSGNVDAPDFWVNSKLVWNDEFDGNALSDSKWDIEVYQGGEGNSELQDYTRANVEVSGGTLKLLVNKVGVGRATGDYTSGRITSNFSFKFGRAEIRAKLPQELGNGLWAKTWMLGNSFETVGFPTSGLIDIMKYVSHIPNEVLSAAISAASFHGGGVASNSGPIYVETAEEEFHTYGVLWTDKYLKFYLDDIDNITFSYKRPVQSTSNNWPFSSPFYFVMNVVVGGEFGGVEGVDDIIFPTQLEIDYVRVYHAN